MQYKIKSHFFPKYDFPSVDNVCTGNPILFQHRETEIQRIMENFYTVQAELQSDSSGGAERQIHPNVRKEEKIKNRFASKKIKKQAWLAFLKR